jgi:hypothetical protein
MTTEFKAAIQNFEKTIKNTNVLVSLLQHQIDSLEKRIMSLKKDQNIIYNIVNEINGKIKK